MRLDDGLAIWLWQALIFALSILSLLGIVLWLVAVTSIPRVAVDAILAVVMIGSGLLHARAHTLARVVVDGNGVRIRRWGQPTRYLSWVAVQAVDESREVLGDHFLELSLTDGRRFRLRSKLELFRREILVARIQQGIASVRHDVELDARCS